MEQKKFDHTNKWCKRCSKNHYLFEIEGDYTIVVRCPDCRITCPECDGLGTVFSKDKIGRSFAGDCPVCSDFAHRIRMFNAAKLPSKYAFRQSTDLGTFITRRGEEAIGNLPIIHSKVNSWVDSFVPKVTPKGFLLYGDTGIGKTYLLAAAVRKLTLDYGRSARFIEYTHLLSELRETFTNPDLESTEIINNILSADVIAIDELGKGRDTSWQIEVITEIISKAYNTQKTLIATTNLPYNAQDREKLLSSKDFAKAAVSPPLEVLIGSRSYSRIHEMMEIWHVRGGGDFRILMASVLED